jgi:hypothetical protein
MSGNECHGRDNFSRGYDRALTVHGMGTNLATLQPRRNE